MSEVTLISVDGIKFQVSASVVRCMGLFKNLLDLGAGVPLPPLQVPNVTSPILDKIIEYLDNYVSSRETMASVTAAGGATKNRKSQAAPLKVKTTISSIVSSTTPANRATGNDDDDDLFEEPQNSPSAEPQSVNDFEIPQQSDDDDDFLDFAAYDDQSLRLFTPFEQAFFSKLDIPTLIELTKAANFLNIPFLLDSCCKAIANHMKGLTVEELRSKFNIKNDFTPEEEERIRRETAWIEE